MLALALALVGGVLAVLIILGKCHSAPGQVVARVGAVDVTLQDLRAEAHAQGRAPGATFTADVLEAVIGRTLLAQEARRRGLENLASFLSERRRADAQVLASSLLRNLPPPPAPSPEQISAYIGANPQAYADRRRLVLDELRFPAAGAPQLQDLTLEEASAQLLAAKIRFITFQTPVVTGALAPALEHALLAAAPDHVAVVCDGLDCTAVRVASSEAAPLVGLSAELSAKDLLTAASRERQLADLLKRLKLQSPPNILRRLPG